MNCEQIKLIENINLHFQKLCKETSYASRLKKETNWSHDYTNRVIEEYKKFLFIFGFTHSAVAPSHAVDLAWHAHILYTKDYFIELPKILGKTLHHIPESPSSSEKNQLKSTYNFTLNTYRRSFGKEPNDIWCKKTKTKSLFKFW